MIKVIIDGIRFMLEITSVVLLVIAGFSSDSIMLKISVGIVAPLAGILIWSFFVAPMSPRSLAETGRTLIEVLIFGGTFVATFSLGNHKIALIYGVISVLDTLIEHLLSRLN